jgi:hypothetical protein
MGAVTTIRELGASVAHPPGGGAELESQASAETSPGEAHALVLDEFSVSQFRQFFELLDEWDRKASKGRDEVRTSTKVKDAPGGAQR